MLSEIEKYSFLKGIMIDCKPSIKGSPHYNLLIKIKEKEYSVNVDVKAKIEPSGLKYFIKEKPNHPILNRCFELGDGIHLNLEKGVDGYCIDYLRSNLFDINFANILPINEDEEVTELENNLHNNLKKLLNNNDYRIGTWGMAYSDKKGYIGVHDIHMNQGNPEQFAKENRIWQDGALGIFNIKTKTVELMFFFMFQSQCIKTDDNGNCCK